MKRKDVQTELEEIMEGLGCIIAWEKIDTKKAKEVGAKLMPRIMRLVNDIEDGGIND